MNELEEITKVDKKLLDKIEHILASELNCKEYDVFYNYFNEIKKPNILIDIKDDENIKELITNLQSKIDKANEILEEIFVVSDWEHEGKFRPVKNTTAQDVYKAVCMLYGILETPYRSDYGALKENK